LSPNEISRLWNRAQEHLDQRRFRRSAWYSADAVCRDPGVFVLGCGRSGTTLVREMLCRHGALGGGPETLFFVKTLDLKYLSVISDIPLAELEALRTRSEHVVRFAEAYYRRMAEREGKRRWIDKTPMHVRALPRLLASFPEARVVHVIRDGRDVACSLRNHPRQRVHRGGIVPNRVDRPIALCAQRWLRDTGMGRVYAGHPRLTELRYEQLVADPEREMRRLLEFLGEPWESGVLEPGTEAGGRSGVLMNNANAVAPISGAATGRWRRDLSAAERHSFDRVAGDLLIALGYAEDRGWVDDPPIVQ